MLWFKFILGLMFFELVSILFAIVNNNNNNNYSFWRASLRLGALTILDRNNEKIDYYIQISIYS